MSAHSPARLHLRIQPHDKAALEKAAKLEHTDLTHFVLSRVLPAAEAIIERSERIELSERDSLRVLELLEHPPQPTQRLLDAARALPVES